MEIYNTIKPVFPNKACIIFSANDAFVPVLSVMVESIIEHSLSNKYYDILILNKNISFLNKEIVYSMVKNFTNISIRFVDVSEYVEGLKLYTANRDNITEEAYYRLLTPWLLDEKYEQAVYLDGDMVVTRDLSVIFDIKLGDNLIGGVRDYWGICNCYKENDTMGPYRLSIGIKNLDNYIISATLIFNLEKIREEKNLDELIELATSRNWIQHDQDVINLFAQDRIQYMNVTWGFMADTYNNLRFLPRYLQEEADLGGVVPNIIHYGGTRKPWSQIYTDFYMKFWQYASNTMYFTTLLNKVRNREYRGLIANKLSNHNLESTKTPFGERISYRGVLIEQLNKMIARIEKIQINKNTLEIEGIAGFYTIKEDETIEVFFQVDDILKPVVVEHAENLYTDDGDIIYRANYYKFVLDLDEDITTYKLKIFIKYNNEFIEMKNIKYDKFSPFYNSYPNSYYYENNWIVKNDAGFLTVESSNWKKHFYNELLFCKGLLQKKQKPLFKAVLGRVIYYMLSIFTNKEIWLISDRVSKADDNGEAFFRFLNENKNIRDISTYFILDNKSTDYDRIKSYGKVIQPYSWKHKILTLLASVTVSSQTDDVFRNPFFGGYKPFVDILSKLKFVFIQHGIISTDLSQWLKRRNQGISKFITSTQSEYSMIKEGSYNYFNDELVLTGLARFDYLENRAEKIITIQPTWRRYLALNQDPHTGVWKTIPQFYDSKYAKFYRGLLGDKRFLKRAKELGYKIQFKIHPCFLNQVNAFGINDNITLLDESVSYKDIYAKSSLIVTDYSSSIYDFIYLRKPIIYTQFDKEEFFSGAHTSSLDKFSYEDNGFGEVEYNLEDTINRIIEYMENNCSLKEKYRNRIDSFFAFNDKNNCKRIFDAIRSFEE